MRICVIFNPVACGNKARHFRAWLDGVASECTLKPTRCAGDARRLAAEAVAENFEMVAAAGGDGTVNEVLNGIGDAPGGFERTRLGVLPLGTVNVFARELNIPVKLEPAWHVLKQANETKIDLSRAEFVETGQSAHRYFLQLGGVGLDARAIELVSWKLKKCAGPFAYIVAGFQALAEKQPCLTASADGQAISGELMLLGNGRFFGGPFQIFPDANLKDGCLDVCAIPKVNLPELIRLGPNLLLQKRLPETRVRRLRAEKIVLTSDAPAAFELDGEWVGRLPATFAVERQKLRVVIP